MTAGKVIAAVFGSIFALVALGVLIGGGVLLWAHGSFRDADGFFSSPAQRLESEGYALVGKDIDLASHPGEWWPAALDATARLSAQASASQDIFIGIGPQDEVLAYLDGVAYSEVRDLGDRWDNTRVRIFEQSGGAPAQSPAELDFWVSSVEGPGEQTLTWELQQGRWSVVIMHADGSLLSSVSAIAGARLPILYSIGIGLVLAGIVLGALASLLLVPATRTARPAKSQPVAEEVATTVSSGAYPATVTGRLQGQLSPVLWLVKWFLLIPHYIVLAFLWAAFCVLTFFAWIAILFTGRYPRGIFDFNVGVMRWTWRVSFYAYGSLATDQYPPFTLQNLDYPARFDVAYPERLSRGLALIKWWLLAIPHYIIVGIFTSGLWAWTIDERVVDNPVFEIGGGLIAMLALIAGVVLLFTGRYPRGIFDFLMGLNRWALRVGAYAALMTDEYPPFRLDLGGEESS